MKSNLEWYRDENFIAAIQAKNEVNANEKYLSE